MYLRGLSGGSYSDRYYICDDCCAGQSSISKQAQLFNAIKQLDPYHIVVGALQCWSGFWQFSDVLSATGCPGPDSPCHPQSWDSYQPTEGAVIPLGESPRLQLSLDVIMWEDYHQFDYPPLSDAPIGKEVRRGIYFQPLVNCYGLYLRPYPGETEHETIHPNSPTATRTSLWLSVLQYDAVQQLTFVLDGNAWAPPEWSSDNGWLQTVAVQGWAAEAKMLTPSLFPAFGSRAFNGTDRPMYFDPPVADVSGSLFAAMAILGALNGRHQSGRGCVIDLALPDVIMPMQLLQVADYGANATVPERRGTYLNGGAAYYNIYETKDHRFVVVGAVAPKFSDCQQE